MTKKNFRLLAIAFIFTAILLSAFCFDSYTRAQKAQKNLDRLTAEVITLQDKAIKTISVLQTDLSSSPIIKKYTSPLDKVVQFEEIILKANATLSQAQVENLVHRRSIDEYQGLLNRRAVLLEKLEEYKKIKQQTFSGIRGKIATSLLASS